VIKSAPLRIYDETIRVLKLAVENAKLGRDEALSALQRLDQQARTLERHASGPSVEELIAEERARSHAYGGRSVFGEELPRSRGPQDLGRADLELGSRAAAPVRKTAVG
jgi:uncharacterized protein